jgi:hypothetical protein
MVKPFIQLGGVHVLAVLIARQSHLFYKMNAHLVGGKTELLLPALAYRLAVIGPRTANVTCDCESGV